MATDKAAAKTTASATDAKNTGQPESWMNQSRQSLVNHPRGLQGGPWPAFTCSTQTGRQVWSLVFNRQTLDVCRRQKSSRLVRPQRPVDAGMCEQILVRALLHNPALLQHDKRVHPAHG